jgi:hypothetical protein
MPQGLERAGQSRMTPKAVWQIHDRAQNGGALGRGEAHEAPP